MSEDKGFSPDKEGIIDDRSGRLSPVEEPLEQLLSRESDSEFGGPHLVEHLDGDFQPLILRDWTAKDFADIYVRFYPHVLRQAKRFLTNHSQAEEVTQDAFLYLMTSLPEVDSEIGVLKLLKWKTRLLALDVISSNSGAKFAPIDDQLELSLGDMELSEQLERADDAAIVALALAKLEPRQRDALVASLYQEKPNSEVAAQLGLSENAAKQLVYRAKAAFRKALVGEAETAGLSVSQILSLAARKAARESGKQVAVAGAFLLALAVSVGLLQAPATVSELAGPTAEFTDRTESAAPLVTQVPTDSVEQESELDQNAAESTTDTVSVDDPAGETSSTTENKPQPVSDLQDTSVANAAVINQVSFASLEVSARDAGFAYVPNSDSAGFEKQVLVFSDDASVAFTLMGDAISDYSISNAVITASVDGAQVRFTANNYASSSSSGERQTTVTFVANDLVLLPDGASSSVALPQDKSTISISIELDRLGQVIRASFFLTFG